MVHVDFPLHFDSAGRTALTTDHDYIRDLIEQVLFTSPGERVNRPNFGSGLKQLVFAPASDELVGTTQLMAQGALQESLGSLIQVVDVQVRSADAELHVTVQYVVSSSREQVSANFVQTI